MITFDSVSKRYPGHPKPALRDITIDVERGDFAFLIGTSGSGKSTLLQLVTRQLEASSGRVRVAGHDLRNLPNRQVPMLRRDIGVVFQDFRLLEGKTVGQNVAFALEVLGTRRHRIRQMVPEILELVGIDHLSARRPHELSGGEQQRVAIARAMVKKPQILLADEPTGNLDPDTSTEIVKVLDRINKSGTTVVMATHDERIVDTFRKRVIELSAGELLRDESLAGYIASADPNAPAGRKVD